jgi:hypothetical protein
MNALCYLLATATMGLFLFGAYRTGKSLRRGTRRDARRTLRRVQVRNLFVEPKTIGAAQQHRPTYLNN